MALRNIRLKDFVLIRELDLPLGGGFTALTGETGAGKSILIDALQLALGARADASLIREGAPRTEVSVAFDPAPEAAQWLAQAGFDTLDGDELILRRVVDAQGKSRAWINGSLATATQLRELAERLVDIHGQHAWQSLMRPDSMRQLLDAYAAIDTRALLQHWQAWQTARQQLAQAHSTVENSRLLHERLTWQIAEVDKLAPGADEWPELNAQHTRLANLQALLEAAQSAADALEDDHRGALCGLSNGVFALQKLEHIEPLFQDITGVLATAQAQVQDALHSLHSYLRKTDHDPQSLAALDERVSQWLSLARRFRCLPHELPGLHSGWQAELAQLNQSADLDALAQREAQAAAAWQAEAARISRLRAQAAPRLAAAITQAMQGLGMQGGQLQVALEPLAAPAPAGLEGVQFLVAGHAGASPRPVHKVASGGELSRLSLAIAVTTSQLGAAPTLIFDEIDAGIGGAVAEAVGRLMRRLGQDRQVLAITHLAQVAACANHQCVVSKTRGDHSTSSAVAAVSGAARTQEIARMLGGETLSEASLAHAREMLENAREAA